MSRPIRIAYEPTGQPLGATFVEDLEKVAINWPGKSILEIEGDFLPDLSALWVVNGALVDRSEVTDQATLDAITAQAAAKMEAQVTTQALAAAPEPVYAAKATQATLTIILPILAKVAAGEVLSSDDKARIADLTSLFIGASSAMAEAEALTYIAAILAKSDAAYAIVKAAGGS